MGKRGPRPQPSELQKRLGTYRPDRRAGEATSARCVPPRPSWMGPAAKKCWTKISPWLNKAGLLTRLDQVSLALLCEALADFLAARDIVDCEAEKGGVRFITTTDKGNVIQHPVVGVMNKAHERLVKLLREFGMTPSARAGIAIANKEAEADPMTELFQRIAAKRMN